MQGIFQDMRGLEWLQVVGEDKVLEPELRELAGDQTVKDILGYGKKLVHCSLR